MELNYRFDYTFKTQDPKKGIEFLIAHSLIKETPEDIAAFLYKGEGLNKTMIGDYLGEKSDFNEAVLKAFVELHDFTDLILVQALRQFLWSFRLPGEAQKVSVKISKMLLTSRIKYYIRKKRKASEIYDIRR